RELLRDGRLAEGVRAIIPVHLYGQMAEIDEITEIAKEHELYVIEDAAQAIGAEYKGRKAGTIGHLGIFSFFPTKNLGAYGDGGLVVTNDDELADKVRLLRVHGARPKYYHWLVGTNSRLDALQAAILRVKLEHLDGWTRARRAIAGMYDEQLQGLEGLDPPYRAPDRTHIFHQYTIRVAGSGRDALQRHLEGQGIATAVYYPLPLHLQECFRHLGYDEGELPESERASREVLSLPMFPELTPEEVQYVTAQVRAWAGDHAGEGLDR
ncbi:TPA: DegT/DnrJ/EryC1/StrS family aminotransferase, partial [Candidatus Bipolaricaulota bacterium]|nr:DegT/DnrJ/EryC1/StrS family aminotransferase [Candidatus Bipolaricaulota bacterium]